MLRHGRFGVARLALDQEYQSLDVTALALRLSADDSPRDLRRFASLDEPLVEEQADRGARVSEGEPGVRRRRGAEPVERLGVPAEKAVDRPVVRLERVTRPGGNGQTVRVVSHGRHASSRPDARRAPR